VRLPPQTTELKPNIITSTLPVQPPINSLGLQNSLQKENKLEVISPSKFLNSIPMSSLCDYNFCVIRIETLLDTMLPCEIGVVVFNLTVGEKLSFHKLIDSSQFIPPAWQQDAVLRLNNVHGIPFNYPEAERNYATLFNSLCNTLKSVYPTVPILWAKGHTSTQKNLNWLAMKAGLMNPFHVEAIEEISEHLYRISKHVCLSSAISDNFHNFLVPLPHKDKCDFHKKDANVNMHCSLAFARALAIAVKQVGDMLGLRNKPS